MTWLLVAIGAAIASFNPPKSETTRGPRQLAGRGTTASDAANRHLRAVSGLGLFARGAYAGIGDVAVTYASVTEKRIRDGKDTGGEFVWMDLPREARRQMGGRAQRWRQAVVRRRAP